MTQDVKIDRSSATAPSAAMRGVVAAIVTPISKGGAPDAGAYGDIALRLLEGGCDGLNVLGTTGEATSFSFAERSALMQSVARSGLPLARMMVGAGAAATADAVALTHLACEEGFAGALVLPPFYYKNVSDDGVVAYFGAIVRGLGGKAFPIYLYNFPALSGVPYGVPLVRRLLQEFPDHIAGLKDSSGDLSYARAVAGIDKRLAVFPSNEAVLGEARTGLFAGCISATVNVNAALCAAAFHKNDDSALEKAVAIRGAFDGVPLVSAVKAVMADLLDRPALAAVKPPLVPLPRDAQTRIADVCRRVLEEGSHVAG